MSFTIQLIIRFIGTSHQHFLSYNSEYKISEKKDSYKLNDKSIKGKGLRFCYTSLDKYGNKQNQCILNHFDFNMECGKVIGLIGLNGTGKTTFFILTVMSFLISARICIRP